MKLDPYTNDALRIRRWLQVFEHTHNLIKVIKIKEFKNMHLKKKKKKRYVFFVTTNFIKKLNPYLRRVETDKSETTNNRRRI